MGGISNIQMEKAFRDLSDPDLLNNFAGVFPSDYLNKFVNHAAMINDSGKYPFIIANTEDSEKDGTHWWSILDIETKTDILFLDAGGQAARSRIVSLRYFSNLLLPQAL